jgi:hypothetical protein
LAELDRWVPDLDLYKCRRARGGYEAVPTWRESSTGRPLEERNRNLGISPKGIRDFVLGADGGLTPIDLVMRALNCDFDDACSWLREQLGWLEGGPAVDLTGCAFEAETGEILAGPAPVAGGAEGPASDSPSIDPLEPYTHPPAC